jgi:hypothetical protein
MLIAIIISLIVTMFTIIGKKYVSSKESIFNFWQ